MTRTTHPVLTLIQYAMRWISISVVAVFALAMVTLSSLAAFGVVPWFDIPLSFGTTAIENAGLYAQLTITGLAIVLAFYLPSHTRIMQLEQSHRQFAMNMEDVTRAYAAAHAADRAGLFKMSSEFDAVRERLLFLRNHPDLEGLEPDVLEVAAQMSQVSQKLAAQYSDEKVARARSFLTERQHEVERFQTRLSEAKGITSELTHWAKQVELDEEIAESQLKRLQEELENALPELTLPQPIYTNPQVVTLPRFAAE